MPTALQLDSIHYIYKILSLLYFIAAYFLLAHGLIRLYAKFDSEEGSIEKKWAYVPLVRIFFLARCARLENSGYVWLFAAILRYMLSILFFLLPELFEDAILPSAVYVVCAAMTFIYGLRIYIGICKLFGRSRRWTILWILNLGWIPAVVWGRSTAVSPRFIRTQEDKKIREASAPLSGITAEHTETGLCIDLESRTVRNGFVKKCLLRDIHMNIAPGRMVLLLGGSGSGKTTLVNAVIGYEKANAHVLLNNRDVYTEYAKMKYDIGMVPQQDLVRYDDTVIRTLTDAARLRLPEEVTHRQLTERVDLVLKTFGLDTVRNSEVEKISGGQKKRLSIAMEFICDPDLFVLDEPDSGLDGVLAKDLMRRLKDISREGKTVLVITHSPNRVIEYFDDIIVLAKDAAGIGRLAFFGTVPDALDFFETDNAEHIIKIISRVSEGGEGRADELITKFNEVQKNGKS